MTQKQNERAVLVAFGADLRLADNPALAAAVATGLPVVPVFVWPLEAEAAAYAPGAATRWWLHQSLSRLEERLRAVGSRLVVRCGPEAETLMELAQESGAGRIFRNRVYAPAALAGERDLTAQLSAAGITIETLQGNLLFEPGSLRTTNGGTFQVFTPFWRAVWNRRGELRAPVAAPKSFVSPERWPPSLRIAELGLEPSIDWAAGLCAAWMPGEAGAQDRLRRFAKNATAAYDVERDRPDHDGTSRLSPHLHFGEVSPQQIWHTVAEWPGAESYLRQIAWREFSYHLLCAFPQTVSQPINPQFRHFPWRRNRNRLAAWQKGRTGYPLVDAAMRQLWTTGWMHNRARMIVASFLVKHLLLPWQEGAAWFLDTLVDADLANNAMGWQWVAGCGVDPAPYFRIFNPVLQGRKFDPEGEYVRAWVPELAGLQAEHIHEPWKAPPLVLAAAGVRLGDNYPLPIVDHAEARAAALAAYDAMKTASRREEKSGER
ncbi:MAG TPA: deoxyribodipyrimidine photo-lyase [Acidobacteriaceae bacterium]